MYFIENYYYISLILQAICVWHCLRKRNEQKWIWLIVFLPVIGCIIYFFSAIVTDKEVQRVGGGLGQTFNPGGRIRKLEAQLKFADTFENRILLADALLATDQTGRAIELYEQSLKGVFAENEHGVMQLMVAYAKTAQWDKILPLAKKVYNSPQFARSQAHLAYAKALSKTGHEEAAEKEYLKMKARFSAFESRYHYGLFLLQTNREEEARDVFEEILEEEKHLSGREKRYHRLWVTKSKEELRKIPA